jgi:hypothetical protein
MVFSSLLMNLDYFLAKQGASLAARLFPDIADIETFH